MSRQPLVRLYRNGLIRQKSSVGKINNHRPNIVRKAAYAAVEPLADVSPPEVLNCKPMS